MAIQQKQSQLKDLFLQLQKELGIEAAPALACPHCGAELSLVAAARSDSKDRRRTKKPASGRKTSRGVTKPKRKPSELVGLALRYAKQKHNGRIGKAYAEVRDALKKETKGADPDQIRQAKIAWFKKRVK